MSRAKVRKLRADQYPDNGGVAITTATYVQNIDGAHNDRLTLQCDTLPLLGIPANPLGDEYGGPTVGGVKPSAVVISAGNKVDLTFPQFTFGGGPTTVMVPTRSGWLRSASGGFIDSLPLLAQLA